MEGKGRLDIFLLTFSLHVLLTQQERRQLVTLYPEAGTQFTFTLVFIKTGTTTVPVVLVFTFRVALPSSVGHLKTSSPTFSQICFLGDGKYNQVDPEVLHILRHTSSIACL